MNYPFPFIQSKLTGDIINVAHIIQFVTRKGVSGEDNNRVYGYYIYADHDKGYSAYCFCETEAETRIELDDLYERLTGWQEPKTKPEPAVVTPLPDPTLTKSRPLDPWDDDDKTTIERFVRYCPNSDCEGSLLLHENDEGSASCDACSQMFAKNSANGWEIPDPVTCTAIRGEAILGSLKCGGMIRRIKGTDTHPVIGQCDCKTCNRAYIPGILLGWNQPTGVRDMKKCAIQNEAAGRAVQS